LSRSGKRFICCYYGSECGCSEIDEGGLSVEDERATKKDTSGGYQRPFERMLSGGEWINVDTVRGRSCLILFLVCALMWSFNFSSVVRLLFNYSQM
jgi:hypothetical protein